MFQLSSVCVWECSINPYELTKNVQCQTNLACHLFSFPKIKLKRTENSANETRIDKAANCITVGCTQYSRKKHAEYDCDGNCHMRR